MMILLSGEKIVLRSVDSSDIDTILLWENSSAEPLYGVYDEQYTREDVVRFVENQQRHSLAENEQLRLMICSHSGERLGCIDLAEYDGKKAFVSILIFSLSNRSQGFGTEALKLFISCCESLGVETLFAIIQIENSPSKNLFEKMGFVGESSTLYRKQLR